MFNISFNLNVDSNHEIASYKNWSLNLDQIVVVFLTMYIF
jgi:hypothetical protein